jgi:hypothetical protein
MPALPAGSSDVSQSLPRPRVTCWACSVSAICLMASQNLKNWPSAPGLPSERGQELGPYGNADPHFLGPALLDRPAGGLGISLTLVELIVEPPSGAVEVRSSAPAREAPYLVRLPAYAHPPREQPETTAIGPSNKGPAPRCILAVDDNSDAVEILAEVLRLQRHQVHVAHNGLSALAAAAAYHQGGGATGHRPAGAGRLQVGLSAVPNAGAAGDPARGPNRLRPGGQVRPALGQAGEPACPRAAVGCLIAGADQGARRQGTPGRAHGSPKEERRAQ